MDCLPTWQGLISVYFYEEEVLYLVIIFTGVPNPGVVSASSFAERGARIEGTHLISSADAFTHFTGNNDCVFIIMQLAWTMNVRLGLSS